jgi:outer membrane protein assembly factor BamB
LEQNDTHVFAWIERAEDPFVVALSKETGETDWKSSGLQATSWSSPRLVPVEDGQHLVLSGSGKIAGFDPASGKQLWAFDGISGNSTPTPMPLGKGRFLIGASEARGETGGGRAADSNGVIQISKGDAGTYTAKFVWRAKKATSSFGSPMAYLGHAYFVNRAGVVYCLDIETGEQRFAERSSGSIWATPLAIGGRLYFFGKSGTTTVIKPGSEFEQLAVNDLWSDASTTPAGPAGGGFGGPVLYAAATAGSQLVLRRGDIMYAVGR